MADEGKSPFSIQDQLGGPYAYSQMVTNNLMRTIADASDTPAAPLDPSLAPDVDSEGVPSSIAAPPDVPRSITPNTNDASQGGSHIPESDEAEAAAAAAAALGEPPAGQSQSVRTHPEVRPFDDQTFLLMHRYNLVNLRNEKQELDLEEPPIDKQQDVDGDKKPDDVVGNTIRSIKGPLPYAYIPTDSHPVETNAVIQCIGDPGSFSNYMTATPQMQGYLNATTEQLSNMVPKIRLFKVFHMEGEQRAVEFAFETAGIGPEELQELLNSRGTKRGYGVGIKSFNVNFHQGNPEAAKNELTADLVIFADSMESLLRVRRGFGDSKDLEYRFMELAFRTTASIRRKAQNVKMGHTSDLNFEILADFGVAGSATVIPGLSTNAQSITAKLIANRHDFAFEQDGSVSLTIEFHGYIEKKLADPVQFDIFSTPESVIQDLVTEIGIAAVTKQCSTKEANIFKQNLATIGNSNYRTRITNLNNALRQRGKIYYINIPPSTLQAFSDVFNSYEKNNANNSDTLELIPKAVADKIAAGKKVLQKSLGSKISPKSESATSPYSNISSVDTNQKTAKSMQNDMENKKEPQSALRDCAIDPNSNQVAFFYVSDLINIILENLSSLYSDSMTNAIIEETLKQVTHIVDPEAEQDKTVEQTTAQLLEDLGGVAGNIHEINDIAYQFKVNAQRLKKFRVVLGPTTLEDYFTSKSIVCSIGDIPIPLRHFNSWLVGQMEGSKRTRYPLSVFLVDFVRTYIKKFLKVRT